MRSFLCGREVRPDSRGGAGRDVARVDFPSRRPADTAKGLASETGICASGGRHHVDHPSVARVGVPGQGATTDLADYGAAFNSIELNATHYRITRPKGWRNGPTPCRRISVLRRSSHHLPLPTVQRCGDRPMISSPDWPHWRRSEVRPFCSFRRSFLRHADRLLDYLRQWPSELEAAVEFGIRSGLRAALPQKSGLACSNLASAPSSVILRCARMPFTCE